MGNTIVVAVVGVSLVGLVVGFLGGYALGIGASLMARIDRIGSRSED